MNFEEKQLIVQLLAIVLFCSSIAHAQAPRKNLSDKHKQYYDSLKSMHYDRVFPLLGERVYKRGFDIPFPIGVMINNFYGNQDITISNIRVGIREPDSTLAPVDLSDVITFSKVNAKAYNINTRVDLYVFPFLNVYGLLAYVPYASTEVVLSKPVQLTSNPKQHGWAYGFGVMGAGGIGPVWLQADYNVTWADMQLLDNKVISRITGIRMGQVFTSKINPERNISLWIGMMGIFLNNNTEGEILLSDVFPSVSQEKVNEIKESYNNWYNGLGPAEKRVADKIVERLQDKVNGLNIDNTYITYEMDKRLKSAWAGLAGVQFQFNKRWQLRMESNFIGGDRFSIMASVNYRFLGFKKKQ